MMQTEIAGIAQADLLLLVCDYLRAPERRRNSLREIDLAELDALVEATQLQPTESLQCGLRNAHRLCQVTPEEQWSGVYRLLFDGAVVCPINEATYNRRDKGAVLGDLCGFFKAFGWNPAKTGERPDHLVTELEFAAMLMVMVARADTPERLDVARQALAEFTRQHLSDWVSQFCEQLRQSTTHELFLGVADLLDAVWVAMIDYHQWPVDEPTGSPVGICNEPESPYECGAPDLVSLEAPRREPVPN